MNRPGECCGILVDAVGDPLVAAQVLSALAEVLVDGAGEDHSRAPIIREIISRASEQASRCASPPQGAVESLAQIEERIAPYGRGRGGRRRPSLATMITTDGQAAAGGKRAGTDKARLRPVDTGVGCITTRWPGPGRSRHDGIMRHTPVPCSTRRPRDRALRVGLTGGIGSGKPTVACLLEERGAVVTSVDEVARDVVNPGSDDLAAVVVEFGEGILAPDGSLDRSVLGCLIFSDNLCRARLEEFLLSLIAIEAWVRMDAVPTGQVAVYDVPLLVGGQIQDLFDPVIVVEAQFELRLRRLAVRGMTRDEALVRIAVQATDEERQAVADVAVSSPGALEDLNVEVDRLWNTQILELGAIA